MATLMDILGGGLPAGLLSPEQEAAAQQRAQAAGLLNFAFGALQASRGAPGMGRPSLGQVIGQAGPVGVAGYQQSFEDTLKRSLQGMQIAEMRSRQAEVERERQRRQQFQQAVSGATVMQPTLQDVLRQQTNIEPERLETMSLQDVIAEAPKTQRTVDRDRLLSAIAEFAPEKYLELTQPRQTAIPTSIQEYNLAVNQGFKGTFQDFVLEQKKAGAPSTNITLPGDKKLGEVLGKGAAERLDNSFTQAQEAQSTLQNISELRPIIEQGVFAGPLSGAPRTIAQIATSLGITGKDTKEQLERTAVAMQGLAKFELSAAAAMRGQGAITENERMLIQRAAAGRLDQFTAPEVQALLTAMEKTANYRIASHSRQLDVLRKNTSPEVRDLLPLYELGPLNVMPTPSRDGQVRRFNPQTGRAE